MAWFHNTTLVFSFWKSVYHLNSGYSRLKILLAIWKYLVITSRMRTSCEYRRIMMLICVLDVWFHPMVFSCNLLVSSWKRFSFDLCVVLFLFHFIFSPLLALSSCPFSLTLSPSLSLSFILSIALLFCSVRFLLFSVRFFIIFTLVWSVALPLLLIALNANVNTRTTVSVALWIRLVAYWRQAHRHLIFSIRG